MIRKGHDLNYSSHFLLNKKYKKDNIFLMGNYGRIFGFVDDDYNSNDYLLNDIEEKSPDVITF